MSAANASSYGDPRATWKFANVAKDFHKRHGHALYTMDFNAALQAEVEDVNLNVRQRLWAAVKFTSWGRFSDSCVDRMPALTPTDPKPQPLTQADLAKLMRMPTSTLSEACTFLETHGYLHREEGRIFPDDRHAGVMFQQNGITPLEFTSDSTNCENTYNAFKEQ